MLIGIIIPAFNAAETIEAALLSVAAQSHKNWVAVVVDDGSTDNTSVIVENFQDPRVRLIRQRNAGVSAARNTGIAAIQPDALLFLDADDRLAPRALAALSSALAAAPWAVAAVGSYARVQPSGQIGRTCQPAVPGRLLEHLLTRNLFANGGHILVWRNAVQDIGGFRTDLRFGEDWEFWVRLALRGPFTAARTPDPLCFIRERTDGASGTMAADPVWYNRCADAIHANPALEKALGRKKLATLRRLADAESHWSVGRELIRHGQVQAGRAWLRRSFLERPTLYRLLLLAAIRCLDMIPAGWRGRFSPYQCRPA